ncbi:DHHA1 domain-containing protein (plasmid) [Dyella sp. BiH032]|uniref:single-stranded-DNA-specific exonuclease RecJ n=1 Tax=Dyella sp. BiH032 TaxID=3075430 RepID=UPI0028930C90|nr:DHHA1 domain-containing protein [Dyella sp. BiH032]WNL48485.1 DHHA1 domain-containing protein [Dyella sp. BiH032]
MYNALQQGYTPLQARVIAGRIAAVQDVAGLINPALKSLDPPDLLPDIDVAASAIADAVMSPDTTLVGVMDHDADGADAAVVFRLAMIDYFGVPEERVVHMQSHRMREGYGVSESVVERLLALVKRPCLVVTGDQGSGDSPRVEQLKAVGIPVVITDHHGVEGKGPPAAVACVNPARSDSKFPDPFIAGVHVMFLVMCAVRKELIGRGVLPANAPSLAPLLAWSCVGTTADAVSLAKSRNNRAVIRYGLSLINASDRAPWIAMRQVLGRDGPLTTKDISHGVAPRINARGRMGDAVASVDFLCSTDQAQANYLAELLEAENNSRKQVEREMTAIAREIAEVQVEAGLAAIVVHLPDGHSGVHGITASRLVEAFGRPVCCLSPKQGQPGLVTGSLRTVEGVHVRNALIAVDRAEPGLLKSFGGHAGAGGCGLDEANIVRFHDALCRAVLAQRDTTNAQPLVWTDGSLGRRVGLDVIAELDALEPYGREFESPSFTDAFRVRALKAVGDGSHLKLELVDTEGSLQRGIWFRAMEPGNEPPIAVGQQIEATYQLAANTFRGRTTVDLQVGHARVIG